MANLKAQLIIEATQPDSYGEGSTLSHPPSWYLRRTKTDVVYGGGGGNNPNPASHPPYWITKEWNINVPFSEGSSVREKLDNSDTFIKIVSTGSSISGIKSGAGARLKNAKMLLLKNCGKVGIEIVLETNEYGSTDQVRDNAMYTSFILGAGEWVVLPTQRIVSYSALQSAGNHATINNTTGGTNLYIDSTADTTEAFASDSDTNIIFDDGSGGVANNMFRVNDLIRIEDEVMRITAINDDDGDDAFTPASFTVDRGLFGTTKANHNANDAIRFAVFNEHADEDKFTYLQTDKSGRLKTSNLILNANQRTTTAYSRNIVRGSFSLKFFNNGYQELGLSGVTPTTSSGLTASTAYQFNISAQGGTAVSISFTTDSSNVNFGGANGVIQKINDALTTQFNTFGGHLFEKLITCSLVNGDIRFTSSDRTTASAVLLADSSGSDTDVWGVGRFPAVANVEAPVSAKLPDDTLYDSNYVGKPNESVFAYDDGLGNISGVATGTINYETGELNIIGPPNAEPSFSFNYNSVHSGGINETSNFENGLISIQARSCNSKVNGEVEVIGFM